MKRMLLHQTKVLHTQTQLAIQTFIDKENTQSFYLKRSLKDLKYTQKRNVHITEQLDDMKRQRDSEWSKRMKLEEKVRKLETKLGKLSVD